VELAIEKEYLRKVVAGNVGRVGNRERKGDVGEAVLGDIGYVP
jgi:hypothetical protein